MRGAGQMSKNVLISIMAIFLIVILFSGCGDNNRQPNPPPMPPPGFDISVDAYRYFDMNDVRLPGVLITLSEAGKGVVQSQTTDGVQDINFSNVGEDTVITAEKRGYEFNPATYTVKNGYSRYEFYLSRFYDDFADPASGWTAFNDGPGNDHIDYLDGRLQFYLSKYAANYTESKMPVIAPMFNGPVYYNYTKYIMQTDVTYSGGSVASCGIVFMCKFDDSSLYPMKFYFAIDPRAQKYAVLAGKVSLWNDQVYEYTPIVNWHYSSVINQSTNTIRLEVEHDPAWNGTDDMASLYVNNTFLTKTTFLIIDGSYEFTPYGKVYLHVEPGADNPFVPATVFFDNFDCRVAEYVNTEQ